ncbi:unnamed protein product [Thelazia callipaeda]|uniref:Eukaryotic translation initiation factor 3 30 kDa subunit n=1 Tax=Thelazia callipaeda TaxID=103827 RepID=A0A0N5CW94_THECL|nr:unnamed protein product [Thelazia callipaeda]
MGDWDDDDFEIDVKQLDEKKQTVVKGTKVDDEFDDKIIPEKVEVASSSQSKKPRADALGTFTNDLSRELTTKDQEELQKKSDLMLAKELFGTESDDDLVYDEIQSLDEFRTFGEKIGKVLAKRSNNAYFSEMLVSLLKVVLTSADASKARVLSTLLKTIADEKTAAEKLLKGKSSQTKPTIKTTKKSTFKNKVPSKADSNLYEDYVFDEYDDYADKFM